METSLKQPITTVKVGAVRLRLDERDLQILHLLDEHKFLTTQQVAKFMHAPSRMFASSVRLASRKMSSLQEAKLITAGGLRRVGGTGQGSEPYVWHLAKLGYDAVAKLRTTETGLIKRPYKAPTYTFANHRVAINDTKLLFRHITQSEHAIFRLQSRRNALDHRPRCQDRDFHTDIGGLGTQLVTLWMKNIRV